MRGPIWLSLVLFAVACTEYDLDQDSDINAGPQPDIELDPAVLSWGIKLPNCPSDPKTVTIRNVGDSQLRVSDITTAGNGASAYSIAAPAGEIVLATGESVEVEISFLAAATVEYPAALEVTSNDPDEEVAQADLSGEGGLNASNEDVFVQDTPEAVDVLWVLDTSCSMSGVVTELETRFDEFIANFVTLGLDYQIGVTTTDMDTPAPGNQGTLAGSPTVMKSATMSADEVATAFDAAVNPSATGSGTEVALGAAYEALKNPGGHAVIDGLVREDANLAIMIVGDEDDQSNQNGPYYASWIEAYKASPDRTTISGIIPMSSGGFNPFELEECVDFMGLPRIEDAIDGSGGTAQNLCTLDTSFSQIMDWLSFTAAGLDTHYDLSAEPANGASGMTVTVNGQVIPMDPFREEGWSFDFNTNQVVFYGESIPGPGAEVVITYPIDGTCQN